MKDSAEEGNLQLPPSFHVVFDDASDLIVLMERPDRIAMVNPSFERITGLATRQFASGEKTWDDCVHEEDMPVLSDALVACRDGHHSSTAETRLLNTNDQLTWMKWTFTPIEDVNGIQVLGVGKDIQKSNERERALRRKVRVMERRNVRAQVLISKLKQFFTRVNTLPRDTEGFLNGVCAILFDMYRPFLVNIITREEGVKIFQAGHVDEAATDEKDKPTMMCEHVMESGAPVYCNELSSTEPFQDDAYVKSLGFETYLGAPLRDSAGRVRGTLSIIDQESRVFDSLDVELITVAALQIASRLRADEQEEEKKDLEEHLRQAQKMKAVGTLAGGIAHDFNNILSGILGFASYLMTKVEPGSELQRNIGLIEQSAVRASELTQQLVAFARRKNFTKKPVCMNEVIEEAVELLKHSMSKNIVIEYGLELKLPYVLGDQGQLHQVIMNLSLNAAAAMEETGGALKLMTESRELTPREKRILVTATDGEYVCITVSDSGTGMSSDVQEHIFDPFFTTKAKEGGTGLGLSIVYGIISNHGGDITVDSEPGEGTTFRIYFPSCHDEADQKEEKQGDAGPISGSETVLVVDDEAIVRQMVSEVLKGHGYTVITADSGEEAVELFREMRDKIDIVLLDIVMPGMDGEETFHALRKIKQDANVLLTSGYANSEKSARLLREGTKGLVHKPYKSKVLLRSIRKALDPKESKISS